MQCEKSFFDSHLEWLDKIPPFGLINIQQNGLANTFQAIPCAFI